MPAVRQQSRATSTRRPHLRVVEPKRTPSKQPAKTKKKSRAAQHAAARQGFVFFAVTVVVVAVLGAGRVWLSVQAAEASLDCSKLQAAVKAARYEGDLLEIQRSALASPSRIQAMATGQLGMGPATSVSYLRISSKKSRPATPVPSPQAAAQHPEILETVIQVAVTEAHMLLVGDMGLSSSN